MNKPNHLVVIDGSHMTYRCYHVAKSQLPKKSNIHDELSEDEKLAEAARLINMSVYLFFTTLFSVMKNNPFSKVVVLYDAKGSAGVRKEIDPEYKSNRTTNHVVIAIKSIITKHLPRLGVYWTELSGLEADDIAYWMSRHLSNNMLMVSEDKDWKSYVTPYTSLYRPINDEFIDYTSILKSLSSIIEGLKLIKPDLVVNQDLVEKLISQKKAIYGDGSDNIVGFDGIGPKSIVKVIIELNSVDDYHKYRGKSKAEKALATGIDRFISNIRVLGYEHIHKIDLTPIFLYRSEYSTTALSELAAEIGSTRFSDNHRLTKLLSDHNNLGVDNVFVFNTKIDRGEFTS